MSKSQLRNTSFFKTCRKMSPPVNTPEPAGTAENRNIISETITSTTSQTDYR